MPALKHLKQADSPATYACDYTTLVAKVALIGITTLYGYDAFGQRVIQTASSSTAYYPNKFTSITNATTTANATSTDYVYAGDTQLETVDQPLLSGVATGTPVIRYIHTDNLGSTNITSDANQNRAQWFDYAPYGSVIASTNTGTTTDARQYIGQFSDASGLSYLNARYYNGAQGQFTSEDPVFVGTQQNLGDPQSLNAYAYSDDNPITKSDPNGKQYVDANGTFTFPTPAGVSVGPTGGVLYGANGPYVYFGVAATPKPGPSGSVTASPFGSPSSGLSLSESYFAANGYGRVLGVSQNSSGAGNGFVEGGYGTPGISGSLTYSVSLYQVLGLAGPFNYVTTPMTSFSNQAQQPPQFNPANLFSSSLQTRISAIGTYNSAIRPGTTISAGGAVVPSSNTLFATPNGAVVNFGGLTISASPKK